jgi:hypothetical protein
MSILRRHECDDFDDLTVDSGTLSGSAFNVPDGFLASWAEFQKKYFGDDAAVHRASKHRIIAGL